MLDPTTAMEGRTGQIIRLHEVVGGSILLINYFAYNLPTRRDNFEWTLGDGVQELAARRTTPTTPCSSPRAAPTPAPGASRP